MPRSTEKSRQRARSELRTRQDAVFAKFTKKVVKESVSLQDLAKVILQAAKDREGSWNEKKGRYTLSLDICLRVACERQEVNVHFARLIYLAMDSWWNDTLDWAKEVANA
jgi:hypothetical protein